VSYLSTARTDDPEVEAEARVTERIITFSDAVIAIAITLLALALPIPGDVQKLTNGQLLQVIWADRTDYFAFLLSFAVIGNQWATHRRVCRYVDQMTGWVGKLNMVWLLMMVLTPFAAKMLAGGGRSFGVCFAIYTLIQIIAEACLMQMSREAQLRHMLRSDAPESARRPDSVPYLAVIITLLVSIPVAFAAGGLAFAVWIAISLTSRGLRRLIAHGRHATGDGDTGSFGNPQRPDR
jgi:uncharacterized membrane protein